MGSWECWVEERRFWGDRLHGPWGSHGGTKGGRSWAFAGATGCKAAQSSDMGAPGRGADLEVTIDTVGSRNTQVGVLDLQDPGSSTGH